jgi:hypothetical protein
MGRLCVVQKCMSKEALLSSNLLNYNNLQVLLRPVV